MNFKNITLNYIEKSKSEGIETFQEEGRPTLAIEKAHDLTFLILKTRFENELRQYNNDEKKAYDEFIARKNLNYLSIYIEEFLLLDKKAVDIDFYKSVRKHMRDLLNNLFIQIPKEINS